MKNESNYIKEIHVKNTLCLEDEEFVEIKEQKQQRGKLHMLYIYSLLGWFKTLQLIEY